MHSLLCLASSFVFANIFTPFVFQPPSYTYVVPHPGYTLESVTSAILLPIPSPPSCQVLQVHPRGTTLRDQSYTDHLPFLLPIPPTSASFQALGIPDLNYYYGLLLLGLNRDPSF